MAVKKAEAPVLIQSLDQQTGTFRIIGRTPLYFNKMSAKAQRTLLVGGQKKTAAEKKTIQKHNPMDEFVERTYTHDNEDTFLCFPAPGLKGAMATAALETAGVTKSSVNRLLYLPETNVRIWGIPQLKMDVVRSADINKTPDVRTRAYLPEWSAEFKVNFIAPTLTVVSVLNLLSNAGMVCGIGDFRVEKGKGSFGTFSVVQEGRELWSDFCRIRDNQGRAAQMYAMENPDFADEDTVDLFNFWTEDTARRFAPMAAE